MIVGLSGYAQSGKDTAAAAFERRGFQRMAFADALRDMALDIDPLVTVYTGDGILDFENWEYAALLKHHGYEWAKEHSVQPFTGRVVPTSPRAFLQKLGVAVRDHIGEDAWVDALLSKCDPDGLYVVTDCRFENEARACDKVFRITRPGVGPANDHISEVGLDDWRFDAIIDNAGSEEQFLATVGLAVTLFCGITGSL